MANCKSCGKTIDWVQHSNGSWVPMNIDGTCHFNTCPYAEQYRGKRTQQDKDTVDKMETLDSKQRRLA